MNALDKVRGLVTDEMVERGARIVFPSSGGDTADRSLIREVLEAAILPELEAMARVQELVFDGHAVYSHLNRFQQGRTSWENVADVLDALNRARKAAIDQAQGEGDV